MPILDVNIFICFCLICVVVGEDDAIPESEKTTEHATTKIMQKLTAKTSNPLLTTNNILRTSVTQFLDYFSLLPEATSLKGYDYEDIWWTTNTSPTKKEDLPEDNNTAHLVENIIKLRGDISLLRGAISETNQGINTTKTNITNIIKTLFNKSSKDIFNNETKLAATPATTLLKFKKPNIIQEPKKVTLVKFKQMNITSHRYQIVNASIKAIPVTASKSKRDNVATKVTPVTIFKPNQVKLIPRAFQVKLTRNHANTAKTLPAEVSLFFQLGQGESELDSIEDKLRGFGIDGNDGRAPNEESIEETTPEEISTGFRPSGSGPPNRGAGAFRATGRKPAAFGPTDGRLAVFRPPGGQTSAFGSFSGGPAAFRLGGRPAAFGPPSRTPVGPSTAYRPTNGRPATFGPGGGRIAAFGAYGRPPNAFIRPSAEPAAFRPYGMRPGALGSPSGKGMGQMSAAINRIPLRPTALGLNIPRSRIIVSSARKFDGIEPSGMDLGGVEDEDNPQGLVQNIGGFFDGENNNIGAVDEGTDDEQPDNAIRDYNAVVSHKPLLGPIVKIGDDGLGHGGREVMANNINPQNLRRNSDGSLSYEEYGDNFKATKTTRPLSIRNPNNGLVPLPTPLDVTDGSNVQRPIGDIILEDIDRYGARDSFLNQTHFNEIEGRGIEGIVRNGPERFGPVGQRGFGPGGSGGLGPGNQGHFGPNGEMDLGLGGQGEIGPGGSGGFGPFNQGEFGPGGQGEFSPGGQGEIGRGGSGGFIPGNQGEFGPGGQGEFGTGGQGEIGPRGPGGFGPGNQWGFGPDGSGGFGPGIQGKFGPGGQGDFGPGGQREFVPGGSEGFGPGNQGEFRPGGQVDFGPGGQGEFRPGGSRGFAPGYQGGFGPGNQIGLKTNDQEEFEPSVLGGLGSVNQGGFSPDDQGGLGPGDQIGFGPGGQGPLGANAAGEFVQGGLGRFGPGGSGGQGPGGQKKFGSDDQGGVGPSFPTGFGPSGQFRVDPNVPEMSPGLFGTGDSEGPENIYLKSQIKVVGESEGVPIKPGMPGGLGGSVLFVKRPKNKIQSVGGPGGPSGGPEHGAFDPNGQEPPQFQPGGPPGYGASDPNGQRQPPFDPSGPPGQGALVPGQGPPQFQPGGLPGHVAIDPYAEGPPQFQPGGPRGYGAFDPNGQRQPPFDPSGPQGQGAFVPGQGQPQFQPGGPPGHGAFGPNGQGQPQFEPSGPPGNGEYGSGQGPPQLEPGGPPGHGAFGPNGQGEPHFQPSDPAGQGEFAPGKGPPQFQPGGPPGYGPFGPSEPGQPQFQPGDPPGYGAYDPNAQGQQQFQPIGPPGQGAFDAGQGLHFQPGGPPEQGVYNPNKQVAPQYSYGKPGDPVSYEQQFPPGSQKDKGDASPGQDRGFGQNQYNSGGPGSSGRLTPSYDQATPQLGYTIPFNPQFSRFRPSPKALRNRTTLRRWKTGLDGLFNELPKEMYTTAKGKSLQTFAKGWTPSNKRPSITPKTSRIYTDHPDGPSSSSTNGSTDDSTSGSPNVRATEFMHSPTSRADEKIVVVSPLKQKHLKPVTVKGLVRNQILIDQSAIPATGGAGETNNNVPTSPVTVSYHLETPTSPFRDHSISVITMTTKEENVTSTTSTTIDVEAPMEIPFPEEVRKPNIDVEVTLSTPTSRSASERLSSMLEQFEDVRGVDTPYIEELKRDQKKMDGGYFVFFLYKLFQTVATKDKEAAAGLAYGFGYAIKMFDNQNLVIQFGEPFHRAVMSFAEYVAMGPTDQLQSHAALATTAMENRRELLSKDLNALMDYLDTFFKLSHKQMVFGHIIALHEYPNIPRSGFQLSKDILQDMVIIPFSRTKGSPARHILLEVLNRYVSRTFYNDEDIQIPYERRSNDERLNKKKGKREEYRRKYKERTEARMVKGNQRSRKRSYELDSREIEKGNLRFMLQQEQKVAGRGGINVTSIRNEIDEDSSLYPNIEEELANLEVPSHKLPTQMKSPKTPKITTKYKIIRSEDFGVKIRAPKEDIRIAKNQRSSRYTKIRVSATTISLDKSVKRIVYAKHPTKAMKRVVTAYTKLSNVNNKKIPLLNKQPHNNTIPNSFTPGATMRYFSNAMGSINKFIRNQDNVKEESITKSMTNTPKFPNVNNNIRNAKEKSSNTMLLKTNQPELELQMFSGETSDTREPAEEKSAKKHHKHKRHKHKKKHAKNNKHKQKVMRQKYHAREKHGHRHVKNNKKHNGKHHNHPKVYEIHIKKHKRRQRLGHSHFNYEKKLRRYNKRKIHHKSRKHGHKRRRKHQHIKRKKYNSNYRRAKSGINASQLNYNGTKLKNNLMLPKKDIFIRDKKKTEDFNKTSSGETNTLDSSSCNSSSDSLEASESNLDPEYYTNKNYKMNNNFTNAKKGGFKYDSNMRFNKEQEELSVEVSKDAMKILQEGKAKSDNTNKNNTTPDNLRHISSESDQEHILKSKIYRYFDKKDKINFKTKAERAEEKEKVLRRNLLKKIDFKQVIHRLSQKLKLKHNITKIKPVNEQSSYSDEEDILKKKLDRFG